jgi:hypothetical protein
MNANYIAQDYIEMLDTQTYKQALSSVPALEAHGGYYLSAVVKPYGNAESLFSTGCVYTHLIMRTDGSMLAVMPDGKWLEYSSVPDTISMSVSGGSYSFSAGGNTKTGTAAYDKCAVIINAMQKTSGVSPAITLGTSCAALVYCTSDDAADIRVSGTSYFYKDIIAGDTSLVYVTAKVYEDTSSSKPVATTEVYVNLRNE